MKRLLSAALALLLLLSAFLFTLPVLAASDSSWKTLTYTLDPLTEGEETVTAAVSAKNSIPRSCTLQFNAELAEVEINGRAIQPGERLETAGLYSVSIVNKENSKQKLSFEVTLLPDINLSEGQVFTEYPTITFSNAVKVEHQRDLDLPVQISSGTQLRELGRHTVIAYGYEKGETHHLIKFAYVIYVRAVHSVRTFDADSGKQALDVIVGSFDDKVVTASLDGKRDLQAGSNIVTEVGTHTLNVQLNGQTFDSPLALPETEELSLRIDLYLDGTDFSKQPIDGKKNIYNAAIRWNEPYYFDFSEWNAEVLLDGKAVSGIVRIDKHGTHCLTVRSTDGKTVDGAFCVWVGDADAGVAVTEMELTFRNPHLIYFIIAAVPAAAMLILACYYLIARRRIV